MADRDPLDEAQEIYEIYLDAMKTLAASHTTVAERKEAIGIRDTFQKAAPDYVAVLLAYARKER